METIIVDEHKISVTGITDDDYFSLTDMAKLKNSEDPFIVINNWMRSYDTLQFLTLWEQLNNPNFKPIDFDRFEAKPGTNAFTISPKKWAELSEAIGIRVASGRNGGTFAHKDIALEFASWISPSVKLYIIKEFQRLKKKESERISWDAKRELSKINYRIHTDAIKENVVLPRKLTEAEAVLAYANEADVLNMALFGMTAQQWRMLNPNKKGNIRDYANVSQLICLSNLENLNAFLLGQEIPLNKRILQLNEIARRQMKILLSDSRAENLLDYHIK
jgi:hypothetical protein